MKGIITKHGHILESDKQLGEILKDRPLMVYKRGKNLRDHLVHSYFPPLKSLQTQTTLAPIPDGNRRCNCCSQRNYTYRCNSFKHSHTGKEIPLKGIISCNTKSVIYLIT